MGIAVKFLLVHIYLIDAARDAPANKDEKAVEKLVNKASSDEGGQLAQFTVGLI